MKFEVGDKVKLIDEPYEGIIQEVMPKQQAAIVLIDGIEMNFKTSQLVKVSEDNSIFTERINKVSIPADKRDKQEKRSASYMVQLDPFTYEIDLHWDALFPGRNRVTDGEILSKKMAVLRECIAECHRLRAKKLVVIHGVGKFILKEAIQNLVYELGKVKLEDASMRTYGRGASVLYFF